MAGGTSSEVQGEVREKLPVTGRQEALYNADGWLIALLAHMEYHPTFHHTTTDYLRKYEYELDKAFAE